MNSFEHHLRELRRRLIFTSIFIVLATAGVFYKSGMILSFFQTDLGFSLNAFTPFEVFYTQLMISIIIGIVLTLPVIVYQALKFAEPGLTRREYTSLRNFLPFSIILFIGGATFAYQFIVKTSLAFFQAFSSASTVNSVWGLQSTIGFALKLSTFTGIFFQLPIISALLARLGLINSGMMKQYRRYFIIAVLVLAAFATPPDIISQALITLPMLGLYEASIHIVKRINK
ncbi:twin-arginine translocase subunit TatC [Candidatus Nanosalina sp. VS9-1]|uniref:twin-arginine translocase subunit TatC n=1 Tax=Candidatus Nanosalina sp. VS9-1 TaxID=3388566 RepID=UPI0039DF8BE0